MRNPTTGAQTSMAIALSLGFLAMSLGAPAFAADRKAADHGVKNPVVTHGPAESTLPISERQDVFDKAPSSSARKPGIEGPWNDALVRLMFTLAQGARF